MQDLRIIKGQEMKRSIVLSTIDLIASDGIEGISTQKLANSLNISKSNIFHHFKSVEAILDEVFSTILNTMIEPISNHHFDNVKEFMMFIGDGAFHLSNEDRSIYIVTFQLYTLSLHHQKYKDLLLRQKEDIVQVISNELIRLSHSNQEICTMVAEMILMTLDGYGLSSLLEENPNHYQKLWELNTTYWSDLLLTNKGGIHD